jgi:hypothetical protein
MCRGVIESQLFACRQIELIFRSLLVQAGDRLVSLHRDGLEHSGKVMGEYGGVGGVRRGQSVNLVTSVGWGPAADFFSGLLDVDEAALVRNLSLDQPRQEDE